MQTIELIENDTAMRALICEWLQSEGYRVRARPRIGNDRSADVDLVVANLEDLHQGAADYVRHVRARYANAPLIGMSTQVTRTLPAASAQARHLGLTRLIPKPCHSSELLSAVVDTIGSATSDGI